MDSERVALKIVAFLLVITAIRKAQRFRFSVLNMYFLLKRRRHDLIPALLARKIRRQRSTSFRAAKKSGVGISQTTRLVWRDVSESSLVCFVEKWLPCFQGDIWLHLPAYSNKKTAPWFLCILGFSTSTTLCGRLRVLRLLRWICHLRFEFVGHRCLSLCLKYQTLFQCAWIVDG